MTELLHANQKTDETLGWLIRWLLGGFLTLVLTIGGAWATGVGASLSNHDKILESHGNRLTVQETNSQNIEKKLDEIIRELQEMRKDARKR